MVEPIFAIDNDVDDDTEQVHVVVDDVSSTESGNNVFYDNLQNNSDAEYDSEDESDQELSDQEDNLNDPTPRTEWMLRKIKSNLDGSEWKSTYGHMVLAMMVTEQVGVRMTKEHFKIEASEATPQYGFRKGLKFFGNKGYQAAKNELKVNLLEGGCNDMLSQKYPTWNIKKQALGHLMFLKQKQSGKMKGRGWANGCPQQEYITKE